jgi:hypothetical protein
LFVQPLACPRAHLSPRRTRGTMPLAPKRDGLAPSLWSKYSVFLDLGDVTMAI